jgi:hypothetical protein
MDIKLCHTQSTMLIVDPCTKIYCDRLTFLLILVVHMVYVLILFSDCQKWLPAGVEKSVSVHVKTAVDYQYTCIRHQWNVFTWLCDWVKGTVHASSFIIINSNSTWNQKIHMQLIYVHVFCVCLYFRIL